MMLCLAMRTAVAADPPPLSEAVMEVSLSTAESGEMTVVLRGPTGQFYLDETDFARLRLQVPAGAPYLHEGHRFYDPRAIKGCTVKVDEATQRVSVSAPAASLDTTHLSAAERRSPGVLSLN
jgi:hypothetical protein